MTSLSPTYVGFSSVLLNLKPVRSREEKFNDGLILHANGTKSSKNVLDCHDHFLFFFCIETINLKGIKKDKKNQGLQLTSRFNLYLHTSLPRNTI